MDTDSFFIDIGLQGLIDRTYAVIGNNATDGRKAGKIYDENMSKSIGKSDNRRRDSQAAMANGSKGNNSY